MTSIRERLSAKINVNGPTMPHMDTPCHIWTVRGVPSATYGTIRWNGRNHIVSRLVWELAHPHEPLPPAVRHRCDNPPCCNPAHLDAGTLLQNASDKYYRNRYRRGLADLLPSEERDIRSSPLSDREIADLYHISISVAKRIR